VTTTISDAGTLREFRRADAAEFGRLVVDHFPAEQSLLGMRPEAIDRVARRIYRWDARLVLGLFRLLGRPIFRFFLIDVNGHVAATTIATFTPYAVYLSSVMVDTPYRRRGFAKRLLERSHEAGRRAGKAYAALDVLERNASAQELYRSMGYRPLRKLALFRRELADVPPRREHDPLPAGVRPFRNRDAPRLADLLERSMPPEVASVLPPGPGMFRSPPPVVSVLESRSAAWVAESDGAVVGFVRASASDALESGHVTQPVIGPGLAPEVGRGLVATALGFLASAGAPRAVAEVPLRASAAVALLEASGFREAERLDTLVRPLGP
jgi:ribosomal protein S18 acetylase RimI-like enzyme